MSEESGDEQDRKVLEEVLEESEAEEDMDDTDDFRPNGKAKKKAVPKKGTAGKKGGQTAANNRKKRTAGVQKRPLVKLQRMVNRENLPIADDNRLFIAVRDGDIGLKELAEEWVVAFSDNSSQGLSELVNFVFRSCGCNESIDDIQVEDIEHIHDTFGYIQESFRKSNMPSYPIVSRSPTYRHFRRRLDSFIEHLFGAATEADVILDETLLTTLVVWLSHLASSTYRAFRHTATIIALLVTRQMTKLSRDMDKQIGRALEAKRTEKRKNTSQHSRTAEKQIQQLRVTQKFLSGLTRELYQSVFLHRCRDADPNIRADCIAELGQWIKIGTDTSLFPGLMKQAALALSDPEKHVRLAAIGSLQTTYDVVEHTSDLLATFTQANLSRMIEVATSDVDTAVSIAAIDMLSHLNKKYEMDNESRDTVNVRIFDVEPRVRLAAARFALPALLQKSIDDEEDVTDHLDSGKGFFKNLAVFLDHINTVANQKEQRTNIDPSTDTDTALSRTSQALNALWSASEEMHNWTSLIELLTLDHTDVEGDIRRRRRSHFDSDHTTYRLENNQESILVEALVVILQRFSESASDKENSSWTSLSSNLVQMLPKLLIKYRTEAGRIANLLRLPTFMQLSLYLEHQQIEQYEALWDQVLDQFQRHTEPSVIANAIKAVVSLSQTKPLSDVNASKLQSLRASCLLSLRGHLSPDMEYTTWSPDDLHLLQVSTLRIKYFYQCFDLSDELEEEDGGQHLSVFDSLLAFGRRGFSLKKEEASTVENIVVILSLYIMWKTYQIFHMEDSDRKEPQVHVLLNKRQDVLDLCRQLADRRTDDELTVARQAYGRLLDIHIMYHTMFEAQSIRESSGEPPVMRIPDDLVLKVEYSTAGCITEFVRKEINYYKQIVGSNVQDRYNPITSMESLAAQQQLVQVILPYVGALRLRAISLTNAEFLLSYYAQLGPLYDSSMRAVFDTIQDVAFGEGKENLACDVMHKTLMDAFWIVQKGEAPEASLFTLAKALGNQMVIRGPHLTVVEKIKGESVVRSQKEAIEWTYGHLFPEDEIQTLILFKAFIPLLNTITPSQALTLKSHLYKHLRMFELEIPENAKSWDPFRSYEQRLIAIASKDESLAARARAVEQNEETEYVAEGVSPQLRRPDRSPTARRSIDSLSSDDDRVETSFELSLPQLDITHDSQLNSPSHSHRSTAVSEAGESVTRFRNKRRRVS